MAAEFLYPVPMAVPVAFVTVAFWLVQPVDQLRVTSVHAEAPEVGAASKYLQVAASVGPQLNPAVST